MLTPSAGASIEDIIPFPATVDDSKSMSDGSCCEDHGLMESGVLPIDERTCLLGQCTSEERSACRPLLRRYAAEQENRMDSPQEEGLQNAAEALRQEYQSTHHLLLLLLLTVSMLIVSVSVLICVFVWFGIMYVHDHKCVCVCVCVCVCACVVCHCVFVISVCVLVRVHVWFEHDLLLLK